MPLENKQQKWLYIIAIILWTIEKNELLSVLFYLSTGCRKKLVTKNYYYWKCSWPVACSTSSSSSSSSSNSSKSCCYYTHNCHYLCRSSWRQNTEISVGQSFTICIALCTLYMCTTGMWHDQQCPTIYNLQFPTLVFYLSL